MAKKKVLSEAQVRRFMGLAGIEPINEMGMHSYKRDEPEHSSMEEEKELKHLKEEEDELEAEDDAAPAMDAVAMDDEMEDKMDLDAEDKEEEEEEMEVTLDEEAIEQAREGLDALEKLIMALSGEAADEEPVELGAAEDAMDDEKEEAEDMEDMMDDEMDKALEEVSVNLSNQEIVNEVARRVAKRILTAKKAQQKLDEALGNKKAAKLNKTRRAKRTK